MPLAVIARITRSAMLEALGQDYVRTARAKGVSPMRVRFVHALRNGILPVVTYLGPAAAALVSGSFVVESLFDPNPSEYVRSLNPDRFTETSWTWGRSW